eukprot:4625861-Pleurochrysis_carterae.AAC.2
MARGLPRGRCSLNLSMCPQADSSRFVLPTCFVRGEVLHSIKSRVTISSDFFVFYSLLVLLPPPMSGDRLLLSVLADAVRALTHTRACACARAVHLRQTAPVRV